MNAPAHAAVWNNVMKAMEEMGKKAEHEATPEFGNLILLLAAFAGEIARAYRGEQR